MTKVIAFQREGRIIIAQVYSTFMERQKDGRYMEVFFCKDSAGIRRRVEKSDVMIVTAKTAAKPLKKSKRRRERDARRERKAAKSVCMRAAECR
jgi:hypothetical protein